MDKKRILELNKALKEGVRSTAAAWDEIDQRMAQLPTTYVAITLEEEPTKAMEKKVASAARKVSNKFSEYTQVTGKTVHLLFEDKPMSGMEKKVKSAIDKAMKQDVIVTISYYGK